jgi:hypothetical protein
VSRRSLQRYTNEAYWAAQEKTALYAAANRHGEVALELADNTPSQPVAAAPAAPTPAKQRITTGSTQVRPAYRSNERS